MKSYDEMADNILRKYNDRLEQKKRRRTIVMRTAASVSGLCAAAVVGTAVWHNSSLKTSIPKNNGDVTVISETETTLTKKNTSLKVTTTSANDKASVIKTTTASSSITNIETEKTGVSVTTQKQKTIITGTSGSKSDDIIINTAASVSVSVNETTAPHSDIDTKVTTALITDYEGSAPDIGVNSYMKKISAFAASLIMMSANMPTNNVYAASNNAEGYFKYLRENSKMDDDLKETGYMKEIYGHEDALDFNEDGKFDLWDVYAHYRCSEETEQGDVPENIMDNVTKNGDFNHDGIIGRYDDFQILVGYYTLNYPVTYEELNFNYIYNNCKDQYKYHYIEELLDYGKDNWKATDINAAYPCNYDDKSCCPPYYKNEIFGFVNYFTSCTCSYNSGYSIFRDMVDKNIIDLDIDGDGVFSIDDLDKCLGAYDICRLYDYPEYGEELYINGSTKFKNLLYKEEEWNKLRNNTDIALGVLGNWDFNRYLVAYFFENHEFKTSYLDYIRNFDSDIMIIDVCPSVFTTKTEYLEYLDPDASTYPRVYLNFNEIDNIFTSFYNNIKSGKIPEPDMNLDGTVDFEDYIIADILEVYSLDLYHNLKTAFYHKYELGDNSRSVWDYLEIEDDCFNKEILYNYLKNCDYDNNEISGDYTDLACVKLYVLKEMGISEDDIFDNILGFYKEHPEMDRYGFVENESFYREIYGEEETEAAETETTSIKSYMNNIDIFTPRNGDANCDEDMNMADAVLIMQSIANPDKYTITDEGKYNADVNSTGDGITSKDAQAIQRKLLGL